MGVGNDEEVKKTEEKGSAMMLPPPLPVRKGVAGKMKSGVVEKASSSELSTAMPPPAPLPRPTRPPSPPEEKIRNVEKASSLDLSTVMPPPAPLPRPSRPSPPSEEKMRDVGGGYEPPVWGAPALVEYGFEVIKTGVVVLKERISSEDRSCVVFGRSADDVDIHLAHPSISRVHAAVQFRRNDPRAFLIDLNSTHGTFLNKKRIDSDKYVILKVGDVVKFGESTRLYVLTGPEVLPEVETKHEPPPPSRSDTEDIRAKLHEVTWGFGEDAVDDDDNDREDGDIATTKEILLPEKLSKKQQQQFERIETKRRKILSMEKELSNIRSKESTTELTDGQNQRISFLTERITKLGEEADEAYNTLVAHVTSSTPKTNQEKRKKPKTNDDNDDDDNNDDDDDDDDFFDRTRTNEEDDDEAKKEKNVVENVKTIKEKVTKLRDELAVAQTKFLEVKRVMESEHTEAKDSLDEFMEGNKQSMIVERFNHTKRRRDGLQIELERLERLHAIASNVALPSRSVFVPSDDPQRVHEQENTRNKTIGEHDAVGAPRFVTESDSGQGTERKEEENKGSVSVRKQKRRRVIGPVRPSVKHSKLDKEEADYAWRPPENQQGDGRTDLNDKYGY